MQEYTISSAISGDIKRLNVLINSAYRGETSRRGWTTEADFLDGIRTDEEALKEILDDPASQMLKCQNEQGEIIGCVHLKKKGDSYYLGMLTVSPELQNQGIGKLFLKAAEDEAKKARCISIFMTVLSERIELIQWYERHGYLNTRQTKPFPMDNPRFGLPKKLLEFVVLVKHISNTVPSSHKPPPR